jgi:HK97 gp10 family phage protein
MAKKLILDGGTDDGAKIGAFLAGIFRAFSVAVENAEEKALLKEAIAVETTSKLLFRTRLDESIAGLPPRVQTGRLRGSISHRLRRPMPSKIEAEVGTNVEYARAMEFGSSKNMPHPFLRPALSKNTQNVILALRRAIQREAANAAKS